ncbi:MAG: S8 family serine peptidase [Chloroflexi bacterium]|nr:S8 family serine peptidase [Chloroflexota bacterium]
MGIGAFSRRVGSLSFSIIAAAGVLVLLLSFPRLAFTAVPSPKNNNWKNEKTQPLNLPIPESASKIGDDLRLHLAEIDRDEPTRVIIRLAAKSDLNAITVGGDLPARREALALQLRQTAVSSQASLITQLNDWQSQGLVHAIRPFWIINAVAATATADVIHQIAARPDVAVVTLDAQRRYFEPINDERWKLKSLTFQSSIVNHQSSIPWGVNRINAPAVWHGLGVKGEGVTIAIMDSGVDWLHPDLYPNYRGNLGGGVIDHSGNWFHTSIPTMIEPVDLLGHGTHVAGTAVGQNGIGVAPGANWIAVSIADEYGFIYESDVHAGFEWIMAPNGDPALAPDIVNNSWGGSPYTTNFVEDIAALQAAGIMTVFAAGNTGPAPESVNSPASYTETLSVAASDEIDAVAWFSSRGPSPLTAVQNPWIAAPGVKIMSALPNGEYGINNGTSMATPHVAGTMALLLSANPALTRLEIADILAGTAVPMTQTHPNNDSGWGLLNAYAAVASQITSGNLQGVVYGDDGPLPDVAVAITATDGVAIQFYTDENGRYQAALQAGTYALRAAPFGYEPFSAPGLVVSVQQTATYDIILTSLPTGTVNGIVRQADTFAPLSATVSVLDTPIAVMTDENGRYALNLPAGNQYKLRVAADGHRLGRAVILPQIGQTTMQDFTLEPAPAILFVDGGKWYFDSYAAYYRDSLDALGLNFDVWTIRNPYTDVPSSTNLLNYDTVIWSNPLDSPGYLGAGHILDDYLTQGGNLLISGQHVGSYDGQGFDTQHWWYSLLGADFMGKTAVTAILSGTDDTLFAGMALTLNEAGSANNQTGPDQSRPRADTLTRPNFLFENGLSGGLQAGHCQPFRIAYFGFGLEGLAAYERAAVLNHSLDYFASPRLETGLQWEPNAVDDFALVSDQLVYTLTARNLSETMTDTFDLYIANAAWSATLLTNTLPLGPCQTGQTVLTIDVPADAPDDFEHHTLVTAVSRNNPAISEQIDLRHKTPGSILLVDDDRWYDQEDAYQSMLDAMNLSYDVWDIGWDENKRGSPSAAFLSAYDIILWYTAYDWFAPIRPVENEALTQYLSQGGRLFLTSQDFLYYNRQTPLAADYLGVIEYRESLTPTQIYGAANPILSPELAGPLPLNYTPYQNFSDGLVPASESEPFAWSNRGIPVGSATAGPDWRSIFLSFPLEKLPETTHNAAMNHIVGWLSDLGETTFVVDRRTGPIGEPRAYTITLRNLPVAPNNQVRITNTLHASLTLVPASVNGGAVYDPGSRQLTWEGELAPGATHQISYRATPDAELADGARLDNGLQVYYGRHNLTFDRTTTIWVNAPDLSQSFFTATTNAPAPMQRITYTLRLENGGQRTAEGATAVIQFSEPLTSVMDALNVTRGIVISLTSDSLVWEGDLAPGEQATVTVALDRESSLTSKWLPSTAVINDNRTNAWLIYNQLYTPPFTHYFPLIAQSE